MATKPIMAKIVGHELVQLLTGGIEAEYVRITCKGVDTDDDGGVSQKTRVQFYRKPKDMDKFPIGDHVEVELTIRQLRLPLSTAVSNGAGKRGGARATH